MKKEILHSDLNGHSINYSDTTYSFLLLLGFEPLSDRDLSYIKRQINSVGWTPDICIEGNTLVSLAHWHIDFFKIYLLNGVFYLK